MARGRMISCSLGSSRKFHTLLGKAGKLGEFAQALYPLIVAHADDFGRLEGDAFTIKHKVFPTCPRTEGDFNKAIEVMKAVGLIQLYTTGEVTSIQIQDFDEHQSGLHKRTKSKFPDPPENSGKVREVPSEGKGREGNRTEEKGREGSAASRGGTRSASVLSDEEFLDQLQASKAYEMLDVRHLNAKMVEWCKVNGKQPTRRRLVNWLSREDKPVAAPNGNENGKDPFYGTVEYHRAPDPEEVTHDRSDRASE